MDLKKLVNILKFGGRFMITDENGDPKAVLMSYEEFEDLFSEKVAGELAEKLESVENVNKEITRAQMQDLREEVIREDFDMLSFEPISDSIEDQD